MLSSHRLIIWAAWIVALITNCNSADAANREAPKKIIVVLADDMGPGDLGCYGGTIASTPRIDALAAGGTRFTQFYAAAPICSPSRAGLLTGMFPARWSITSYLQTRQGNQGCEQADYLDPRAPTIPRLLHDAGYATAHFGKWHLGGGRDVTDAPKFAAYGYDQHAGTWESPEPDPKIASANWVWSDKDPVKRWQRTAYFIDKTLDFLARHNDQPCFVNLWLDDTHTPWIPGPGAPRQDTPRNLKRVVTELDRQIGRLIDGLDTAGAANDTLLIFISDNGPLPTFDGRRTTGLRGSKLSLYEGGIRLPLIVSWPGHVPAGRVDDETVIAAVDLLPTVCSFAGAKIEKSIAARLDGEDMSAALSGQGRARQKPLFWEYGRNNEFFSCPKNDGDRSPNLAVRDGKWKLLINSDGTAAKLYDLVADKNETRDLSADIPDVMHGLSTAVLAWRKSLPAPANEKSQPSDMP